MPKKNQPGCPCCSQKCPLLGCDEAPFYIQVVDAVLGTVTLSWQGGTASELLIWTGTSTYQYPGGNDCPARRVPLTWTLTTGGALSVSWPIGDNNCPANPVFGSTGTATFVYSLSGRVECDPFSATYLTEKIPPSNPYAILTGGSTASATLSASTQSPQEMNRAGCCYYPCGKAPPILNITIACEEFTYGPFPMTVKKTSTGFQGGCCVYETAPGLTAAFPGTAVCPAVPDVPVSYSYNPCTGEVVSSVGCGPCDFECPYLGGSYGCFPNSGEFSHGCPGTGTGVTGCGSSGEGQNGVSFFQMGTTGASCSPYSNVGNFHWGIGIAEVTGWTTWTFYGGDCASPAGQLGPGPDFTVTISEPIG